MDHTTHINQMHETYQNELSKLLGQQTVLQQELNKVSGAIQQYTGALKTLEQLKSLAPQPAAAPATPATPVSTTPAAPVAPATTPTK